MTPRSDTDGTPSKYSEAAVRRALGLPNLGELGGSSAARVTFLPSFHAEGAITAAADDRGTRLALVHLQDSLRPSTSGSDLRSVDDSEALTSAVRLSEADARRLWGDLRDIIASGVPRSDAFGIDGVRVVGEFSGTGQRREFEAWSPASGTPQAAFVHCLFRAAAAAMDDDPVARTYLEKLWMYLDLGLPLKVQVGPPRVLRIFGAITSQDEAGLPDALNGMPTDQALIIDMSDFEVMAGLLHPLSPH